MSTVPARMLPDVYTWSFPGSPLEIQMQLSVVHEMARRLARIPGADEKSGPEGGLLLGRKPRPGITQVTGFCPLPALDDRTIEGALAENAGQAVGFYRPTSGGFLSLSESDTDLAKRFFAVPGSVVLLIEMDGPVIGKAAFAFWDPDAMTDFPLMEFPFDGYQLAVDEAERRTRNEAPIETPKEIDLYAAAPAPAPASLNLRGVFFAALMVLTAGSAGYFWFHGRPAAAVIGPNAAAARTPGLPASTLDLAAQRQGSDLLLSWNTRSPAVLNASFGVLLIRGDGGDRQIALSADQVRSGKVLYTMTSEELEIQLNVINRDKVSRDSVVVVLAQKPPSRTAPQANPRSQTEVSANPDTSGTQSRPSGGHEPLKAFTRPAGSRTTAGIASIAEPPSVAWSPIASGAAGTLNAVPTVPSSPSPLAPASSYPGTAARGPAPSRQAVPPVPLRQPVPKITESIKTALTRAVAVQVKLSIDAKGRVVKTEPVAPRGVNPLLVDAAMEAGRFWTFQPALVGTRPVPSEMVVTFNFAAAR